MDTHDPYLPPEPYRHRFSKMKNPGGIINEFVGRDHPMLNAQQLQGEIDAYDGGIAYADEDIGRMLQELRQRGILENTIVIFTSDHGEELGEHGFYGHGKSLYREEIQVPLIVWWPGHVPAGVRVAQPVTNTALPATIASLVGVNDGMTFPGPSLAQAWETTATPRTWPDPLSEVDEMAWVCDSCPVHYGSIKSLISARWHFIEREGSGTAVDELYDLTNDRSELQNLANRPDLQGTVAAFRAELRKASPSESGVTRAIAEPRASQ
jgi:choline-sulfatase